MLILAKFEWIFPKKVPITVLFLQCKLYSFTCDVDTVNNQGAVSIRKTVLPGMAITMLKIRRPNGRLIFNMEIAIRR